MNEQILPLPALQIPPLPDEDAVRRMLDRARTVPCGKLVVLNDGAAGIQAVHDVPVYTDWRRETLLRALREPGHMVFILTDSRCLSHRETQRIHRELAGNLAWAARQSGTEFQLLSQGNAALRGHYPLETETLRQELEKQLPVRFDGEILMPYSGESGCYTIRGTHYVRTGDVLVPAGQTEFARDAAFGYRASDLADWCGEMTEGRCAASGVVRITLDELRAPDVAGITGKLMDAHDFTRYAVDAADDRDAEVFAAALLQAIAAGKRYLFRCAAGLVRVLGRVERRAPLTRAELQPGHGPGLILVGSHTKKTTDQLQHLLQAQMLLEPICFDVSSAADSAALTRERDRVLEQLEKVLAAGHTAVVYISRRLIPGRGGSPQEDRAISARISQAIASLVAQLHARPGYIIAKGGITSSDVGVRGLGMQRAWVLGQLLPGVSVWRTGEESRFPGLPYVIFPGYAGEADSLRQAAEILEAGRRAYAQ